MISAWLIYNRDTKEAVLTSSREVADYPERVIEGGWVDSIWGTTPQGLFWTEWLEGPQGAGFKLFQEPHHTDKDVKHAKAWLRRTRDVSTIKVQPITFLDRPRMSRTREGYLV